MQNVNPCHRNFMRDFAARYRKHHHTLHAVLAILGLTIPAAVLAVAIVGSF